MLQPLLVRVFRVADLIHHADAFAVVSVDRLEERDRVTDRVEREHDVPTRDVKYAFKYAVLYDTTAYAAACDLLNAYFAMYKILTLFCHYI